MTITSPALCAFCHTKINPPHDFDGWKYACSQPCFFSYRDAALLMGYCVKDHKGARINPHSLTQRCVVRGVRYEKKHGWYKVCDPAMLAKMRTVKDGRGKYMFELQLGSGDTIVLHKDVEEVFLCLAQKSCTN